MRVCVKHASVPCKVQVHHIHMSPKSSTASQLIIWLKKIPAGNLWFVQQKKQWPSFPSHLSIQLILLSSYPLPRVTRKDLSTKVVKHSISAYHHECSPVMATRRYKNQTYYKLKQQNVGENDWKCVKVIQKYVFLLQLSCTNTFQILNFSKKPHINV